MKIHADSELVKGLRRSWAFSARGVLCLFAVAWPLWSQEDVFAERFVAVVRYWEWSAFWGIDGLDFPMAKYQPGRSVGALVFASTEFAGGGPYWGFCSRDVGTCQVYRAWSDDTVYEAQATRIRRGETEKTAFDRFHRQRFVSDDQAREVDHGPTVGLLGADPSRKADTTPYEVARRILEPPPRWAFRQITLPGLGVPEAIRKRSRNILVEQMVLAGGSGRCEVIVPFADAHSPLVPVMSICPEGSGIQFIRKNGDEWIATAGGWMPQKEVLRRFEPLIRKYASLTLTSARP